MANFQVWPVEKLRDFIIFSGATPNGGDHDSLLIQAVQVHSTNDRLAHQFESRGHQGNKSAPAMSHNAPYPPYPGGFGGPPGGNPYSDPSQSGSTYPPATTPSYPPATAPSYPPAGSAYPPSGPPAQSAYPDIDFAAGVSGAPAPAAPSNLPAYMNSGPSQPLGGPPGAPHFGHGPPSAHPHHTSAPSAPFSDPSAPSLTVPTPSAYPIPGQQAPGQHAPSAPYPAPSAPNHNPTPSAYPTAAAPHHNPSPSPSAYPTAAAPTHSSPYAPSPYPTLSAHNAQPPHAAPPFPGTATPTHSAQQAPYPPHGAPQQAPRQQAHGSPSSGRKKALLIGCNYPGTSAELRGCCTDVQHVEYLLRSRFGFEDITILRDDQHDRTKMPTRNNILRNMDALVRGATAGDSLFFHFSGHGSQKRDWSGDESDGMNETICPTDFKSAGQIIDDELNKRLVNPLGRGVRLHALLDACHSGTGMDLMHITKVDKRSGAIRWKTEGRTRKYKGTNGGLAVQFGACKDSQTAADTASLSGGTHTGAATFLFIQACERLIKHQQPLTYSAILRDMLHQIEEFNRKNGRGSGGGGLGGGIAGLAVGALMGAVTGHGLGGAISGAMSALSGGSIGGQTPQLSASDPVDLDMQLQI